MNEAISPIAKAVFLCDDVVIDELTGKPSIKGLFNSLAVDFFPNTLSAIDEFCVFVEFVGGLAQAVVRVEVSDARDHTVVFRTQDREVLFPGRHTTIAINFRLINVELQRPGVYFVEVYCNDSFVDDRLLRITASDDEDVP